MHGGIIATLTIEHAGCATAIARGFLHAAAGKLMATAETTCLLFDAPAGRS